MEENELKLFNQEEIMALKGNQKFVEEMSLTKDAQDIQRVFGKYGVEMTEDEAREMMSAVQNDELDANALEHVSGGSFGGDVYTVCRNTCVFLLSWCYHKASGAWKTIKNGGKK